MATMFAFCNVFRQRHEPNIDQFILILDSPLIIIMPSKHTTNTSVGQNVLSVLLAVKTVSSVSVQECKTIKHPQSTLFHWTEWSGSPYPPFGGECVYQQGKYILFVFFTKIKVYESNPHFILIIIQLNGQVVTILHFASNILDSVSFPFNLNNV